jgi:hypothetical protein
MFRFITALVLLIATSCSSPYHCCNDDERRIPQVAILHVHDDSGSCLPWKLSNELTQGIRYRAANRSNLCLIPESEIYAGMRDTENVDYFSGDLSFTKHFCDADYIVVLELMQHDKALCSLTCFTPFFSCGNNARASTLGMKMRIEIIDARCSQPRIVLQEVIAHSVEIAAECDCIDYNRLCWGTKGYFSTPYGIAHKKLMDEVMNRIETILKENE